MELVLAKKKDLMRKITLVPIGGLGNRIEAISSVIAYCHAREIYLEVIWFKDHGLNCDFDNLFMINKSLKNIEIRNANIGDLFLRDNPRRRNFWIPFLFEYILYDKCIYCSKGDFKVQDINPELDTSLDLYKSIFMVSWGDYWTGYPVFQWLNLNLDVETRIKEIMKCFSENTIRLHIRRTDSLIDTEYSPTELYINIINKEIEKNNDVNFYLASDSVEEKEQLVSMFGDRIITSWNIVERNTKEGIIDAFVEMNVLSRTSRLYSGNSSFARMASRMTNIHHIILDSRTI